jgi:hypothetical protein
MGDELLVGHSALIDGKRADMEGGVWPFQIEEGRVLCAEAMGQRARQGGSPMGARIGGWK